MNVETPSSCCTSPAQASTEIIPLPTLNYYMNADLLIALICVSILALALTMWIIIDHRCLKTRKTTTNMFGMSSQPAQRPSDNMQTTLRLGKDTLVANPWYPPSRLLPMASSLNGSAIFIRTQQRICARAAEHLRISGALHTCSPKTTPSRQDSS